MNELTLIYQLAIVSFAASISPGPNNIMLLSSGANHGYRRTLPHILGVITGYNGLIILSGLGLGAIFIQFPVLQTILKIAGSCYLLYLAWRTLKITSPKSDSKAKPFNFFEAVLFQFINPKAWILAITIIAAFTNKQTSMLWQLFIICSVTFPLSFIVSSSWTLFGVAIANFLHNPRNLKIFNRIMACSLLLAIYWIIK